MATNADEHETLIQHLKARTAALDTSATHLETCTSLRSANTTPQRPGENDLNKLDFSIKRNTTLLKKLKAISDDTVQAICTDIAKTNQSKYISEAVGAILEAPLRAKDVPAAVQVCSVLHQRYTDVAGQLQQGLLRLLAQSREGTDEERITQVKRRALLRLLGDLYLVGLLTDAKPLLRILQDIASSLTWERDKSAAANNVALLAHFCKAFGHVYLNADMPAANPSAPGCGTPGTVVHDTHTNTNNANNANNANTTGVTLETQTTHDTDTQPPAAHAQPPNTHAPYNETNHPPAVKQALADQDAAYTRYTQACAAAAAWLPSDAVRNACCAVVEQAFTSACGELKVAHALLIETEASNARVLNNRGELPEDLAQRYEQQAKALEALQKSLHTIADATGWVVPEVEDATTRIGGEGKGGASVVHPDFQSNTDNGPFEDEWSRQFYEGLPDLRALVPGVLLQAPSTTAGGASGRGAGGASGDTDGADTDNSLVENALKKGTAHKEGTATQHLKEGAVVKAAGQPDDEKGHDDDGQHDGQQPRVPDVKAHATPRDDAGAGTTAGGNASAGNATVGSGGGGADTTNNTSATTAGSAAAGGINNDSGETGEGSSHVPAELLAVLATLPTCTTPQQCDELCVAFCFATGAHKASRRRLARALTDIPYSALDVIPYYARIGATLATVFPDIINDVLKWLEGEFTHITSTKDVGMRSMAPRVRCMRYMGELAKFRLMPYGTLFSHLKHLLDDFTGAHVEMVVELMQVAGRFLYRLPETHTRADNMSTVMLKLKNAKNLDPRLSMLVEHAYLCVKPPAGGMGARIKQRPPEHAYVQYLLLHRLDAHTISKVVKKLRRLPWPACQTYVTKYILKTALKGRFAGQEYLAALVAALGRYHPGLAVRIGDEVLERIRLGLEHPQHGTYQRRVALVHFLAHLYNYGVVDSRAVFDTLYLFTSAGHDDEQTIQRMDAPSDCFRIRLICALLLGCGQYFLKGRARIRLTTYLMYLQRYILSKVHPLPLDIEYLLEDLWTLVQPLQVARYDSFEAAAAAVASYEQVLAQDMAAAAAAQDGSDSDDERMAAHVGSDDEQQDNVDVDHIEDAGGSDEGEQGEEEEDDDVVLIEEEEEQIIQDPEFEAALASVVREAQGTLLPTHPPLPTPTPHPTSSSTSTVAFRVVLRKGGREDRSKEVHIPAGSGIAAAVQAKAAAEADERALMKRLVLEASAREEDERRGGGGGRGGRGGGRGGGRRGGAYVASYGGRGAPRL